VGGDHEDAANDIQLVEREFRLGGPGEFALRGRLCEIYYN
jgi:hypothetical protein